VASVVNTQITRQPWDAGAGTATWDSPSATLTRSVTGRGRALITVGGWWDDTNGTSSATPVPTDNNGTFTAAINPTTTAGQDPVRVQVAYQFGPTVASHVVTPPGLGSFGDGHLALLEVLGVTDLRTTGRTRSYHTFFGPSDPQNIESISATTSGGTTPKAGDLAIMVVATDNDNATSYGWVTPSGWTLLDSQAPNDNAGFFLAYKVLDADGHVSVTANWDDPTNSTNVAEIGVVVFAADAKEVIGQADKAIASPAASVSRAFPANVTEGSMVSVVAIKYHDTISDPFVEADCTKSAGTATIGTITLDRSHSLSTEAGPSSYISIGIWSLLVTADGSLTMQVGGADANTYWILVSDELAGNWDSSRAESGNNGGTATDSQTTATTGDATTAGHGVFVGALGLNTLAAPATLTHDAAFTSVAEETDGANNMVGEVIRRIVASGTTDAASWSAISGANFGWCAVVQAYRQAAIGDVTPPVLSVPTGSATGSTTADVGATTDEANGTMWAVLTASSTQPSTAQIKAGQDHTGAAAAWGNSQLISTTGAKALGATGLTPATAYYGHVVHTDSSGNDSNRVSSAVFTTDQRSMPSADVVDGAWTPSTGADLYAVLDENPASDADYIQTNSAADSCTVALASVTDPTSSAGHKVSYRLQGDGTSGVLVELLQGATVIASWTHDPAPSGVTQFDQTLSGPEADSISDYTALRARFTEV